MDKPSLVKRRDGLLPPKKAELQKLAAHAVCKKPAAEQESKTPEVMVATEEEEAAEEEGADDEEEDEDPRDEEEEEKEQASASASRKRPAAAAAAATKPAFVLHDMSIGPLGMLTATASDWHMDAKEKFRNTS